MIIEIGTLYCNTLSRIPDQKEVLVSYVMESLNYRIYLIGVRQCLVGRVLKNEARCKYKQKAAISFCNSRLAELRAEERRRVKLQFVNIYCHYLSLFYAGVWA